MAKLGKTFTALFAISAICLAIGSYLAITEILDDPLGRSFLILIVGATFIALGLAALYSGIKSYRHHRVMVLHIKRHREGYERVRVKADDGCY